MAESEESEKDFLEMITEKEHVREFSNDIAKILYVSLWFFFGLQYAFTTNANIITAQLFYVQFDFLCILYIFLSDKAALVQKEGFLRIPSEYRRKALISNTLGALEGLFLLSLLIVFWESISRAYLGSSESLITFQITRTIPTEELTFRGLGLLLITVPLSFAFRLRKSELDDRAYLIRYYLMWTIAVIFIGVLFGLYHLPKYYDAELYPFFIESIDGVITYVPIWIPILYLSLLGILLGYLTYRHGLVVAIFIHIVNNLLASGVIGILMLSLV